MHVFWLEDDDEVFESIDRFIGLREWLRFPGRARPW